MLEHPPWPMLLVQSTRSKHLPWLEVLEAAQSAHPERGHFEASDLRNLEPQSLVLRAHASIYFDSLSEARENICFSLIPYAVRSVEDVGSDAGD